MEYTLNISSPPKISNCDPFQRKKIKKYIRNSLSHTLRVVSSSLTIIPLHPGGRA